MANFNKFQLIVLAAFVVFIIAGVAAFAMYRGGSQSQSLPAITIWGTFPADKFNNYVNTINNTAAIPINITYAQKSASQFSQDFIAALARGNGPDAILIPAELILSHEDKLALIPYSSLSQRDFLDIYISEAKMYLTTNGIIGFPFAIDPMVMYWNRDMFDAAGLATYPQYWDDFGPLTKALTVKDANNNIRKSAIAMGQFSNVNNAREILGTLFMQSGNPVTTQGANGIVVNNVNLNANVSPESAIKYFIQFINPSNPYYSWNRSLPESKSAFLSGTLATYFGFASELTDIRAKNPNLNFDVALMPKPKTGGLATNYGRMYGFSLVRSSTKLDAAYSIISTLSATQSLSDLSKSMYCLT